MWPFLIFTGVFSVAALLSDNKKPNLFAWALFMALYVFFIGLRHSVGMDWNNYLRMIVAVYQSHTWETVFDANEAGYRALLLLSSQMNLGIYGANFIGAIVMGAGIFKYSARAPWPWIALLAAIPYLSVVVGMSANRQAIAIGILLWACAEWDNRSMLWKSSLILLATLFHFSAISFFAFLVMGSQINRTVKIAMSGVLFLGLFAYMSASSHFQYYSDVYGVGADVHSSGALMHVSQNAFPALAALMMRKKYRDILLPTPLLKNMALVSVMLFPAALVSSVAAGRITLYMFPVSIYILSSAPRLLEPKSERPLYKMFISTLLFLVAFVWLSFANSRHGHVPYENVLFIKWYERELCCTSLF